MEVVCGEGHLTTDCYAAGGEPGEVVTNDRRNNEYYLPVSSPCKKSSWIMTASTKERP